MESVEVLFDFVRRLFLCRDKISMATEATDAIIKHLPENVKYKMVRAYFPDVRDSENLVESPFFRIIHSATTEENSLEPQRMLEESRVVFFENEQAEFLVEKNTTLWVGAFFAKTCYCAIEFLFEEKPDPLPEEVKQAIKHVSEFLGHALENFTSLKIVSYRLQKASKIRAKQEMHEREAEEKHLLDLVLLAARMSDKLNSPISMASSAFRNLQQRINKILLNYEKGQETEALLRLQSIWFSYQEILEKSFVSLDKVSRELLNLRDEVKFESKQYIQNSVNFEESASIKVKSGGTIQVAQGCFASTLEPGLVNELHGNLIVRNIYDTLVKINPKTLEIEPWLAAGWTICRDNRKYIFELKKDVLFHDGTLFNADSVCFSLGRQIFSQHPLYSIYNGWKGIHTSGLFAIIESIQKIDDYSVEITLKQSDASFLSSLTMNCASMVSSSAALKYGQAFEWNPVGTGPFRVVEIVQGQKVVLAKFENYWNHKPHVDNLVFTSIDNPEQLLPLMKQRQTSLILTPELAKVSQKMACEWPNAQSLPSGAFLMCYLAFNTRKYPLNNINVRKAIAMAFNKKAAIAESFSANTMLAKTLLPSSLWGYNNEIVEYPYSPDYAHRLLVDSGFSDGFSFTLDVTAESAAHIGLAKYMRAGLASIGIDMHINMVPWKDLLKRVELGEHDAALVAWRSDNGDPDNFLYVLLHGKNARAGGTNLAQYNNQEVNWLLDEAKRVPWIEERSILYRRVQEIANEELPWLPICQVEEYWMHDASIQAFHPHPLQHCVFNRLWVDAPAEVPVNFATHPNTLV